MTSGPNVDRGVPARRSVSNADASGMQRAARAGTPELEFAPLVTPYEELTSLLLVAADGVERVVALNAEFQDAARVCFQNCEAEFAVLKRF